MESYEFNLAPAPAHLQAIGMVVVESAALDNVLELAIWHVEGLTPDLGRKVSAVLMTPQEADPAPSGGLRMPMSRESVN